MKDVTKFGKFELHSIGGRKWFRFGLPTVEDEMSMCRSLYTNEVVKLNIQVIRRMNSIILINFTDYYR